MERNTNTEHNNKIARDSLDLDALLHPAGAFAHPYDVVGDPDLTLNEKRAILSSWASDICAVEAAPMLRQSPGGRMVQFDDIMDALRALDRQAEEHFRPPSHYRRVLADRVPGVFGRKRPRRGTADDDNRSRPQG